MVIPAATRHAPRPTPRRQQVTRGYRVFQVFNALALTLVVVLTLYPFFNILARSFSETSYIRRGEVNLLPKGFNLTTYGYVMSDPVFWNSYKNTVIYTVVATAVAMVLTTSLAYVLSKKHLKGRTFLIGVAVFTMFFNGGIIPQYVLISSTLGMRNTIWAIVLPNAISVFNLLVMKSFFENQPPDLEEAGAVDGLNTYGILLRIVLPLSKAVIATMILFYSVTFWNSWFQAFLYLDRKELWPVTIYLRNLLAGAMGTSDPGAASDVALQTAANIQAVTIVLIATPIMLVYPFIQRYFVTGVMLGSVKG